MHECYNAIMHEWENDGIRVLMRRRFGEDYTNNRSVQIAHYKIGINLQIKMLTDGFLREFFVSL
jgi:hypothetical protein